ncbi:MAG: hypothetical protein KKG60_03795 [Nanoarchaeota archaeon]|nr:hypothetical protein [Nanoarchaeota archaeon]
MTQAKNKKSRKENVESVDNAAFNVEDYVPKNSAGADIGEVGFSGVKDMPRPMIGPDGEIHIPEEVKKKLEKIKTELDEFKKKLLRDYRKHISGIVLLPPRKEGLDGEKLDENRMYVLVLYDDYGIEKLEDKFNLRKKMQKSADGFAKDINKNLVVELMSLYELRENCFDGKWDILRHLAIGGHVYDPRDWLAAIKVAEVHKQMVTEKFERYIVSYIAVGSLFRDEKSNDIDVIIVVDDTDVKRMPRMELRDRLRAIIIQQSFEAVRLTGVKKQFHIQAYILTDFWESLKDAHPVIFTMLRDGVPLYDRGVFMAWKLLLKQGRIRPSAEFIDMQMSIGEKLIERTRFKLLSVVSEELYYALLNPAQAALMLYGANPPTPRETIKLLREIFVKKEKYFSEKYVKTLEEVFKYYKDIEHGRVKDVKGAEIDRLLDDAKEYLKKLDLIFKKLQKKRDREKIKTIYDDAIKATRDVLNILGEKGELLAAFRRAVNKKELPKNSYEVLKRIEKMKSGKLKKGEMDQVMRDARIFIRDMTELVQRKRMGDIGKARVRFKHNEKFGELYLFDKKAFLIDDSGEKEREYSKAGIGADGSLKNIVRSNISEFEEELSKAKISENVSIKEKTIESLKKLFGENVEILIGY